MNQTWSFPVRVFDDFLLKLFEKYAELLKKRFSDDFQEVRQSELKGPSEILTLPDCIDR
jgi:hypothetical protein